MLKRTEFTYVWDKDDTWVDEHLDEIKELLLEEAADTKMKKFWIKCKSFRNTKNGRKVKMTTNSRYVFCLMLETEINELIDKRIKEKMKEMINK